MDLQKNGEPYSRCKQPRSFEVKQKKQAKLLQRKPSDKSMRCRKPTENQLDSSFEEKPPSIKLKCDENMHFEDIGKRICYISPRNNQKTHRFFSKKGEMEEPLKPADNLNRDWLVSLEQIAMRQSPSKAPDIRKISHWNKERRNQRKNDEDNSISISNQQIEKLKKQNQSLRAEVQRLKFRAESMREQNSYIFKQLEMLNQNICKSREETAWLKQQNRIAENNLEQKQKQIQELQATVVAPVKDKQGNFKDFEVIEHLMNKFRHESQSLRIKNEVLRATNLKLAEKVEYLLKCLVSDAPIKKKRSNSSYSDKIIRRESNKENIPVRNCNNSFCTPEKKTKNSAHENIFELSPE